MRKRNTEQTFVDLYLYFAKRGHFPLPPELASQKKRRPRPRDGDLLTPPEAADFLKVSVKTLNNWRWTGAGPAFKKIGRSVLYDFEDIKSFVSARSRRSTSDAGLKS